MRPHSFNRVPAIKLNRSPAGFQAAIRKWHAHPRAIVEGDSWFEYDAVLPINPTPANLFLSTCEYFDCVALVLSQVGDTVAHMLGPYPEFDKPNLPIATHAIGERNLAKIAEYLRPQNRIDVLFFSGGGNDVVDNLAQMLRPYEPDLSARDALIDDRVEGQIEALRQGYRRLLAVRDRISPYTWVFTHRYGIPNLARGGFRRLGVKLTSDWIKPQFRSRGYLAPNEEPSGERLALLTEIVTLLMGRFGAMLASIEADKSTRRFFVAATPRVLGPDHWRDEMHLTDSGFRVAAQTMRPKLKELFPTWTA
jgi:hypothetical protein